LHHIGVASGLSAAARRQLRDELAGAELAEGADHPWADWKTDHETSAIRLPGPQNRWTGKRDQSWVPIAPDRVAEVAFQGLTSGRLRHPARFLRWRVDREPAECTYTQVEIAPPAELSELFGLGGG
jgi:ATP-dependent DNA ligase